MDLKLSVKASEAREEQRWKIRLPFNLRTPVPSTCQPAVDATSRVKEVVSAGTIESVAEEVAQNALSEGQEVKTHGAQRDDS